MYISFHEQQGLRVDPFCFLFSHCCFQLQEGFYQIFDNETALVTLVQSLDPKCSSTMIKTLEILSVVALVKHGVERILNAFTDAAYENNLKERFWILVEGLKDHKNGQNQLAISCIQLLNCLITNHDDFEQRFHLRSEIYRTSDSSGTVDFRKIASDIEKLLQEEKSLHPELESECTTTNNRPASMTISNSTLAPTLSPQKKFLSLFQTFFTSKDEDFDEFANRFENIRFDFDNVDDCFKILRNSMVNTPVEPIFLSIHQLLLYIRDDPYTKYYLYFVFYFFF